MKESMLTFDVEDWFCVRNMRDIIPLSKWRGNELRIVESTNYILKTLREKDIKATFFVLGWIAEKVPELVRDIHADGHEIASHGYSHTPVTLMTPRQFSRDLERSLKILEVIAGRKINGFRAPSFSITRETMWALDIMKSNGITYDSSIYPTRHPDYGMPHADKKIHKIGGIIEIPMNSHGFLGQQIPISGGGYFRLYPYWLFKKLMDKNAEDCHSITYFHPWEFDPGQPKVNLRFDRMFRHYYGLSGNRKKFERLLADFKFTTVESCIRNVTPAEFQFKASIEALSGTSHAFLSGDFPAN